MTVPTSSPAIKTSSPAESDTTALKNTLVALEKRSWEAWKNRDAGFFEEFLSEDHIEIYSTGRINKAAVLATVATPACVVRSYAVDKFQLTAVDADAALLTYYAEQDTTCGGKRVPSPTWVSSLFAKRNGRRENVFYQQSASK